jgi:hypothetical protein
MKFVAVPPESELAEAQALIHHLQSIGGQGKADVARKLHDEIAGLMVAAVMDLSAAAPYLPSLEPRKSRTAPSVSGSRNFMGAILDVRSQAGNFSRAVLRNNEAKSQGTGSSRNRPLLIRDTSSKTTARFINCRTVRWIHSSRCSTRSSEHFPDRTPDNNKSI